jgi:hypothetical protein
MRYEGEPPEGAPKSYAAAEFSRYRLADLVSRYSQLPSPIAAIANPAMERGEPGERGLCARRPTAARILPGPVLRFPPSQLERE